MGLLYNIWVALSGRSWFGAVVLRKSLQGAGPGVSKSRLWGFASPEDEKLTAKRFLQN